MRILAIETSCDETGIAILETTGALGAISPRAQIKVLADVLVSQASIHAEYGGVFPSLARREHAKNMMPLIIKALGDADLLRPHQNPRVLTIKERESLEKIFHKEPELFEHFKSALLDISIPDIDAVAVTSGPGLEPALWVGINTAEALGALWGIPVIPVNHMEGHIATALLVQKPKSQKSGDDKPGTKYFQLTTLHYPSLALLISGGHTELILMARAGSYEVLGQTRDDAVGEAFDKVARMLGLAYPGGPEISKLAEKADSAESRRVASVEARPQKLTTPLPRPMLNSKDFDFSFSGLKTSVLYAIKKFETLTERDKELIAKDFEDSVTEVLLAKTLAAAKKYNVYEIILGGGVSANKKIRSAFINAVRRELPGVTLFLPDQKLSTDNGLMIGVVGLIRSNKPQKTILAEGTLRLSKNSRPTLAELRKNNKKAT